MKAIWIYLGAILQFVLILAVMPAGLTSALSGVEESMIESAFGKQTYAKMVEIAEVFLIDEEQKQLIVESIDKELSGGQVNRPAYERARGDGMSGLVTGYIGSRIDTLNSLVRNVVMRLESTFIWTPLLVLAALGFYVDGVLRWRKRTYTFDFQSTKIFTYAKNFKNLGIATIFMLVLQPFPLHPYIIPGIWLMAMATSGMVMIPNLPKRI